MNHCAAFCQVIFAERCTRTFLNKSESLSILKTAVWEMNVGIAKAQGKGFWSQGNRYERPSLFRRRMGS